jgi:hypothetical protein
MMGVSNRRSDPPRAEAPQTRQEFGKEVCGGDSRLTSWRDLREDPRTMFQEQDGSAMGPSPAGMWTGFEQSPIISQSNFTTEILQRGQTRHYENQRVELESGSPFLINGRYIEPCAPLVAPFYFICQTGPF